MATTSIVIKRFKDLTGAQLDQLDRLTRERDTGAMRGDLRYGRRATTASEFWAVLAEHGNAILGWWSLQVPPRGREIFVNAFVHPDARGHGLATSLGRSALTWSKRRWPGRSWVAIAFDAAGARLYEQLGFRPGGGKLTLR